ncbi:MAG: hypothetical protein HQL07_14440 [Nitrospirae bacterium]|nr:hypothetical protein [Magnetococcales bacterium]
MSQAIAFDTYTYVKKLRDAGVDERQAAIQAEALVALVEDRLTTKKDLAEVEVTVGVRFKELDVKIESVRSELKRDIKELDAKVEVRFKELDAKVEVRFKELDVKIESVRSELKRDIKELDVKIESVRSELKRDIKELEQRMVIKLGSLMFVAVGAVAALVKLL